MVSRILLWGAWVAAFSCDLALHSSAAPHSWLHALPNGTSRDHLVPPPCAPKKKQVQRLQPTDPPLKDALFDGGVWTGVKFFLHDQGAFNFSDTVQCFFDALGKTKEEIRLDEVLLPSHAEHIVDVFLIDQLKRHPGRVTDASAADVHIIGAAIGTSFRASSLPNKPCGSKLDHYTRVDNVLAAMANLTNMGSHPWLFIDTDRLWHQKVLTPAFGEFMKANKAVLATADIQMADYGAIPHEDVLVIPYKAHSHLDDERGVEDDISLSRKTSFTFHGRMLGSGHHRSLLFNITDGLPSTSVNHVHSVVGDVKAFSRVSRATATTLLDSAFCLVPEGATASSRRLFDALSAGCIPIIFNDFKTASENLPFTHNIDWAKVAYFAGSLRCVSYHVNETKAWLEELWNAHLANDTDVTQKRILGHKVFFDLLSYRKGDVVSPMLAELGVRLSRRAESAQWRTKRLNHIKVMALHHVRV